MGDFPHKTWFTLEFKDGGVWIIIVSIWFMESTHWFLIQDLLWSNTALGKGAIMLHDFFFFFKVFVWCGPFLKSLFTLLDNGFCSSARDLTNTLCFGRQSLNPKITREVQVTWFFNPCVGHPYIYQASSITMRPSKKIGGTSISTTEKGTRMRVGVDKERQDADGSHPCSICKSLCSHPLSSWLREMFASGV